MAGTSISVVTWEWCQHFGFEMALAESSSDRIKYIYIYIFLIICGEKGLSEFQQYDLSFKGGFNESTGFDLKNLGTNLIWE